MVDIVHWSLCSQTSAALRLNWHTHSWLDIERYIWFHLAFGAAQISQLEYDGYFLSSQNFLHQTAPGVCMSVYVFPRKWESEIAGEACSQSACQAVTQGYSWNGLAEVLPLRIHLDSHTWTRSHIFHSLTWNAQSRTLSWTLIITFQAAFVQLLHHNPGSPIHTLTHLFTQASTLK